MTREKLIEIFKAFYPNMSPSSKTVHSQEEKTIEISCIENYVKYSVLYDQDLNQLEIIEYSQYSKIYNSIVEGSPEDIIKLAKLLQ